VTDGDLRKLFRTNLPQLHWTSIETGGTEPGVPDSNVIVPNCQISLAGVATFDISVSREMWIEHKVTRKWSVRLRTEQIGWIKRRVHEGGTVWIAVRRQNSGGPRRGAACDELWLVRGAYVAALATGGLQGLPEGALAGLWEGGPSAWDWCGVLACLRTGTSSSTAWGRGAGREQDRRAASSTLSATAAQLRRRSS
jgi:hypothetical protein